LGTFTRQSPFCLSFSTFASADSTRCAQFCLTLAILLSTNGELSALSRTPGIALTQNVFDSSRRTIPSNLHWSIRDRLARISCRHPQRQASRRKSVRFLFSIPRRKERELILLLVLHRSFFQSLCVLGYCIFPLDLAAFVSIFVKMLWIRLPICAATFGWSVWGKLFVSLPISSSHRHPLISRWRSYSCRELFGWN